mgnify:CR=1
MQYFGRYLFDHDWFLVAIDGVLMRRSWLITLLLGEHLFLKCALSMPFLCKYTLIRVFLETDSGAAFLYL